MPKPRSLAFRGLAAGLALLAAACGTQLGVDLGTLLDPRVRPS